MRSNGYLIKSELSKIANSLNSLAYTSKLQLFCLDDMADCMEKMKFYLERISEKRIDPRVITGLSNTCRNAYALNMKMDEAINLIKESFQKEGLKEDAENTTDEQTERTTN